MPTRTREEKIARIRELRSRYYDQDFDDDTELLTPNERTELDRLVQETRWCENADALDE